jgi:hypothetical protein
MRFQAAKVLFDNARSRHPKPDPGGLIPHVGALYICTRDETIQEQYLYMLKFMKNYPNSTMYIMRLHR